MQIAPSSLQARPPASVTVTSFHDFGLTWTWNRYGRNRRTLSTLPPFTAKDAADGHRLPESSDSLSSSSSMNGVSPSCSETVPRSRAVSGSSACCCASGCSASCCCAPLSVIVTSTEDALPAVRPEGRLPSATVNVSSSPSASSTVEIAPVNRREAGRKLDRRERPVVPVLRRAPGHRQRNRHRLRQRRWPASPVTVTGEPSTTGFGVAESDTATATGAAACRVNVTV